MKKLLCISRNKRDDFLKVLDEVINSIETGKYDETIEKVINENEGKVRGCFIFDSFSELKEKIEKIKNTTEEKIIQEDIYFSSTELEGKIAFLFPGQGSQKVGMFSTLLEKFPQMKESIEIANETLKEKLGKNLSEFIYPQEVKSEEEKRKQLEQLTITNITQPVLGVIEMGLFKIINSFGILPDMAGGHSLGEYVALSASGIIEEKFLYTLLESRGRAIIEGGGEEGKMMAIGLPEREVKNLINGYEVYISNLNSPSQTIIAGRIDELEKLKDALKGKKIKSKIINVSCAFHSPFMEKAKTIFDEKLKKVEFKKGKFPVYSNLTGEKYPDNPDEIRNILSNHLIKEVRFIDEIENMYRDGSRVFIEVGPGNVLTGLVNSILSGKNFISITIDKKDEIEGLLSVLAICFLYNKHTLYKIFS